MKAMFKILLRLIAILKQVISISREKGFAQVISQGRRQIKERGWRHTYNAITGSSAKQLSSKTIYNLSSDRNFRRQLLKSSEKSNDFQHYENRRNLVPEYSKKIICLYLPQFHPFSENDFFWGKGFTEWTNVTKSLPLFEGHEQPRYPSDLGYYDLRCVDTIKQQTEIARNYGVHGFCIYYYWFNGKPIMDKPIELIFKNPDIPLNYCLCWANENWTRRWDGRDAEVLLEQKYNQELLTDFFYGILKYLKDPRYIKHENKPVIMIYRPQDIPNLAETLDSWRKISAKEGIGDIYFIATEAFEKNLPENLFDAITNFPPNNTKTENISLKQKFFVNDFAGAVFSYDSLVKSSLLIPTSPKRHPAICLNWDNSPRRGSKANVTLGFSPIKFRNWLKKEIDRNISNEIIFINAWNEWAEGTYLEPDRRNGYANLQSIYATLNETDSKIMEAIELNNARFKKKNDYALVFHIHYYDVFFEFIHSKKLDFKNFDIYLSITDNINSLQVQSIISTDLNVHFSKFENIGRDVLPFLSQLKSGLFDPYDFALKLHTKKSPHVHDGESWRDKIYNNLCSFTPTNDLKVYSIIAPEESVHAINLKSDRNAKRLRSLLTPFPKGAKFVAGTMFWFVPVRLKDAITIDLNTIMFEHEPIEPDGSWPHVLERYIGACCSKAEGSIYSFQKSIK